MSKLRVLNIDANQTSQSVIKQYLDDFEVTAVFDAESAIVSASEAKPDIVILEMSLSGHSGLEFLYEFRTYVDWLEIPVIVYSSVKIHDDILNSRSWSSLNIYKYLYKPESTLEQLSNTVKRAVKVHSDETS